MIPRTSLVAPVVAMMAGAATPDAGAASDAGIPGKVVFVGGRSLAGWIGIDADGVMVGPEPGSAGPPLVVPWTGVVRVAAATEREPESEALPPSRFATLPAPWRNRDVGRMRASGTVEWSDQGTVRMHVACRAPDEPFDAFHFVYRPITGTVRITARVLSIEDEDEDAQAGVMIATGLTEHDHRAFLGLRSGHHESGANLRSWGHRGGSSRGVEDPDMKPPYWVRLARESESIVAHVSPDGETWRELATHRFRETGDLCFVGLAAKVVHSVEPSPVVIEHVTVEQTNGREDGGQPLPESMVRPRILLTSGTVLAADPDRFDDSEMAVGAPFRDLRVPFEAVARIEFVHPLGKREDEFVDGSRSGAFLRDGDFHEGVPRDLAGVEVTVESLLFGPIRYAIPDEVDALVFRPVGDDGGAVRGRDRTRFVVSAADGTRIVATSVAAADAGEPTMVAVDPAAGPLEIPLSLVREIRRLVPEREEGDR